MIKVKNAVIMLLCAAMLCAMMAGCGAGNTPSSVTSSSTTNKPTGPKKTAYTVQLVTKSGRPVADAHVAVYADEALTQHLTTIHADKEGLATYTGEQGATYYMVPDDKLVERGFVPAPYYTVTEAFTALVLEIKLPESNRDVKLGDIMCDLDLEDWNGNRFLLSERIATGKPCIIWAVRTDGSSELMTQLQKLYVEYGDQLDILVVTDQNDSRNIKQLWRESGATFPAADVSVYSHKWMGINEILVIDRYGRLALEEIFASRADWETLQAIADYFTDENYLQDRVFEDTTKLWDYLDNLKYTEEATYRVKVVDGNGNPLSGVGVYLAYRNHNFLEQTDEHGIASWTLQQRDDLIAYLMGDSGTLAPYIIENQGPFAPGTTEKTIVRRDREIVTYTLKTVDIHGNPVPGVQFTKFLDDSQAYYTDENGFAQWEGMDVDNPCKVWGNQLPEGYVLDSFTREGNTFTALLRPIVTYTIKVVDENGNPMRNMHVRLISEQDSDSESTDANGEVRLKMGENSYTVKISNIFRMDDVDDYYDQIFQLPMGQTEATFVWVDEIVTYKFKVVDKDGNPIAGLDIDVLMEQTNATSYPHEKTDKNGEATIRMRKGKHKVSVTRIDWDFTGEGETVQWLYGTFELDDEQTEFTFVVGEPEKVENP